MIFLIFWGVSYSCAYLWLNFYLKIRPIIKPAIMPRIKICNNKMKDKLESKPKEITTNRGIHSRLMRLLGDESKYVDAVFVIKLLVLNCVRTRFT